MKKFLLVCFLVLMTQSFVLADEIIDVKGNIIPCKIETVMDGLVEYKIHGKLYTFHRQKDLAIYNDYVDVREKFSKGIKTERYFGKVIYKDLFSLKLRNEQGDIEIPWYRVKFIGLYKPE